MGGVGTRDKTNDVLFVHSDFRTALRHAGLTKHQCYVNVYACNESMLKLRARLPSLTGKCTSRSLRLPFNVQEPDNQVKHSQHDA